MNSFMRVFKSAVSRFWVRLLCFGLTLVLFCFIFNLITDGFYMNRHYGSYQDKLETLKSIDGPKTVFVGGSSVLCGINAEHYSEISGQCAVNMGLQALKSPDIYLSCILPYINSGDTVFIAFE